MSYHNTGICKFRIVYNLQKENKRYIVYKFFKEGYEIKITGELKNLKFNTLKDVKEFLRFEGVF